MIISASYRTDIPTFYGEWFMNRIRQGYCKIVNPYNRRISRIALDRSAVEGIVFWTKNVGPFLKHLAEVQARGYPFILQHTINSYPRALESAVVDSARCIDHLRRISEIYGPKVCVWRYDTIVDSSVTPLEFHLENFGKLARHLEGAVDEVVVSFAHIYKKTLRNMNAAAEETGFSWRDPSAIEKRRLLSQLIDISRGHGIQLAVCSQPDYLVPGAVEARCVDADRLSKIAGKTIAAKIKGNRPDCKCFRSVDIGDYDTCPHGCVYCYAVLNRELALERHQRHDPRAEFLFPPPQDSYEEESESPPEEPTLFPLAD